jgi:hypothetical protein
MGWLYAQTPDDALRLSFDRNSGTARSLSLSNAMGALGGDYSSIGINPAGIAVYRSSEFTFTPSLHINTTSSDYYGTVGNDEKISFPLQQIGFVGTYKPIRESSGGLISTHFSIGYNRSNTYSKTTFMQSDGVESSLLDEFVYHADGLSPSQLNWSNRLRLAYDARLLDPLNEAAEMDESLPTAYYHAFEELNNEDTPGWGLDNGGLNQRRLLTERGYAGDFHISGGANFSNAFYIGGTLGIASHNYKKEINHYEQVNAGNTHWDYLNNYTYEERLSTNAIGVNLKVGTIYKPVSALRLGIAFHSPTMYSIDEEYDYSVDLEPGFADYETYYTPIQEFSYNMRTPYKLVGSFAYIFDAAGLISLDYEFTDYSTMRFKSKSNNSGSEAELMRELNNQVKETYARTHNLRIGAEVKPTEVISLRAGAALYQSPYSSKYLNTDDTFYSFSGGIGYRMNNMFIDFAYMLRREKYIQALYYSAFVSDEEQRIYEETGQIFEFQKPAKVVSNNHQIALTLGWRF